VKQKNGMGGIGVLKWLGAAATVWFLLVALPSFAPVRAWFAAPLVISDESAQGEYCYVLAGGNAYWERLATAADLLQSGRVRGILVMRESRRSSYSFKAQSSRSVTQWALAYLAWRGVPYDKVTVLEQAEGFLGTLSEARNVANRLPKDVTSLVLVTSAPHMRRTMLAFRRALPVRVRSVPYIATGYEESAEMFFPIWVEYLKLLVYFVVA
jgi:uncharacterized SAM-binding protein YcdF (DUF218 family)